MQRKSIHKFIKTRYVNKLKKKLIHINIVIEHATVNIYYFV